MKVSCGLLFRGSFFEFFGFFDTFSFLPLDWEVTEEGDWEGELPRGQEIEVTLEVVLLWEVEL